MTNSSRAPGLGAANLILDVAVVGAGPAGLMAAETLARAGIAVTVFERMPSPARKLLMAGRGGLNLTHSEPLETFLTRYRPHHSALLEAVRAFPPEALVNWAGELGIETFTGSSGRIFPKAMKASPLLRAWLARLDQLGLRLERNHRLTALQPCAGGGIDLTFARKGAAPVKVHARAALLALGGGSWPRLGSDGSWVDLLASHGIAITPLAPANAGLHVAWTGHFAGRFSGTPLKRIRLGVAGQSFAGELMITRNGLEGGPAYAASHLIREMLIRAAPPVPVTIDLRPDLDLACLSERLERPRGKQSFANALRKAAGLAPAAASLLREAAALGGPHPATASPNELAALIKALPVPVQGLAGLDRAISTAGGIANLAHDSKFMLRACPGLFAAGEMLDWEAPTGGYLLQASFATGRAAGCAITDYVDTVSGLRPPEEVESSQYSERY